MGWRLRVSDKTVRKLAELPIYCQWQKCSRGNVVSGSIRFMQIFAGVCWRGGVKWESGRKKWRFSVHWVTVFQTFYIHGHTTAYRWYNCQWPWAYFKVTGLFHIKFLNKKAQQSWQTSALAMHLPLARLVSTPVIFCLLPSSSIVILAFYLFYTVQTSEQHV